MYVKYGILADAVVASAAGKWNLIGTFTNIWITDPPHTWPRLGILIRMEFDRREAGDHVGRVDFVDPTGTRLGGPPEFSFTVPSDNVDPSMPIVLELALEVNNLTVPGEGNYDFTVRVDGTYLYSIPLYVRERKKTG